VVLALKVEHRWRLGWSLSAVGFPGCVGCFMSEWVFLWDSAWKRMIPPWWTMRSIDVDWFLFLIFPRLGDDGIMARRYDAELKDRAVRLLSGSRANYTSETKALQGVAKSLGIAAESLRRWQERSDTTNTADPGESEELRKLRRENAELRRANEILSSASAFS
jgi:transposase